MILFITQAKDERPSDLDENARTVINWYMNDWSGKAMEYRPIKTNAGIKKNFRWGGGPGPPHDTPLDPYMKTCAVYLPGCTA